MDDQDQIEIGIVSSYPPRSEHHSQMSGVASMAKNQANCLTPECRVTVYSNIIENRKYYCEDGIEVNRCWTKGFRYLYQIPKQLYIDRDHIDIVHLHHEYNGIYGGLVSGLCFPVLILILKLLGFKVVTRLHGVIFNVDRIPDQLIDSSLVPIPAQILNAGLIIFNSVIISLSNKTLVFEDYFKKQISSNCIGRAEKISVIPHGIEDMSVTRSKSRRISSEQNILFFGYLSPRKGPDVLLDAAEEIEDWSIVIAGGPLPYLDEHDKYESYYQSIVHRSHQLNNVILTGFVNESDISHYFSSADIVILPYRIFIAASGVHSLAMKFGKPVLVSEQFSKIFDSSDLSSILKQNSITKSELTFNISNIKCELSELLIKISNDEKKYQDLVSLSAQIREKRSWGKVADMYLELYRDVKNN